jgi:hypothetical protein
MAKRIKAKYITQLLEQKLEPHERKFVRSIVFAQKQYPTLMVKKYNTFWNIYDRYFIKRN